MVFVGILYNFLISIKKYLNPVLKENFKSKKKKSEINLSKQNIITHLNINYIEKFTAINKNILLVISNRLTSFALRLFGFLTVSMSLSVCPARSEKKYA